MSVDIMAIAKENIENRVALVFVSSTFRDMKKEREYLAETVFPRIKVYCKKRDIEFVPIDLRWGITKEQSNNGETLKRCLEEIDRSRPFFICLLGDRYGSTISSMKVNRDDVFWLNRPYIDTYINENIGVTESEIRYGVLDLIEEDKEAINAHFWFRSPSSSRSCDPRLTALKEKIRNELHKYPIDEYGKSKTGWVKKSDWLEKLGVNIEKALKDWIDKTWPDDRELGWLEKQNLEQSAFEHSRRHLYVENPDDYNVLDAFVADGESRVLAVTGPSGLGKSSLLINWVKRYQDAHPAPEALVLSHYVSASEGSDQPADILRRFTETLDPTTRMDEKDEDNLELLNQSKSLDDRRKEFALAVNKWIMANPNSPLVIVIDGLNQLSEYDDAKILSWMPEHPKTKVIVSTVDTDKDTRAAIDRHEWKTHNVQPLTDEQKRKIIEGALKGRGRGLSPERTQKIVESPITSNPLALCVLLDELCCFSDSQLDDELFRYTESTSLKDLLTKVFERVEMSLTWIDGRCGLFNWFGRKKVVPILASLIAVSRYGLTANELEKISGCSPLAVSTFLSVFDTHLVDRSGRYSYSHGYIRTAIEERYASRLTRVRELLAGSFREEEEFKRRCQEVPWQLKELGKWKALYKFLLDLDVFDELYDWKLTSDFCRYWNELMRLENGGYKFNEYLKFDDSRYDDEKKASLWFKLGHITSAYNVRRIPDDAYNKSLSVYRDLAKKSPDVYNPYVATTLNNLGLLHKTTNFYSESESEYAESLMIRRTLAKRAPEVYNPDVATTLNNLGLLHRDMGSYSESESEYAESLSVYRDLAKKSPDVYNPYVATTLNNLGLLHRDMGSFSKSESELKESLTIYRGLAKKSPDIYNPYVASTLNNLGLLHRDMCSYPESESEYAESLTIRRTLAEKVPEVYNSDVAMTLNNLGTLHRERGSYSKSESELEESLTIRRALAKKAPEVYNPFVASTLNNLGLLHRDMGIYLKSESELEESLTIYRGLTKKSPDVYNPHVAMALNNLGNLHCDMGVYLKSESELEESLTIYRGLAKKAPEVYNSDVAMTLFNLNLLYGQTERYDLAKEKLLEYVELYQNLPEAIRRSQAEHFEFAQTTLAEIREIDENQ